MNLNREKGRIILYKLARKCDVFLENFKPGATQRLMVNYETISKVNTRIIYCSITGFGQTGPDRDYPAYNIVIQGMGGLIDITGESDRLQFG